MYFQQGMANRSNLLTTKANVFENNKNMHPILKWFLPVNFHPIEQSYDLFIIDYPFVLGYTF